MVDESQFSGNTQYAPNIFDVTLIVVVAVVIAIVWLFA